MEVKARKQSTVYYWNFVDHSAEIVMTGCYCLRNNNWVKELYTFCRVVLYAPNMRTPSAILGCRTPSEKLLPLCSKDSPRRVDDGGHNKLKNRTALTFLCIQSPTCLTKHVTSLNLISRRPRKTPNSNSTCQNK